MYITIIWFVIWIDAYHIPVSSATTSHHVRCCVVFPCFDKWFPTNVDKISKMTNILLWIFVGIWIENQIIFLQWEFSFQHQEAKCFCTGIDQRTNKTCLQFTLCPKTELKFGLVTPDLSPVKNGSPRLVLPIKYTGARTSRQTWYPWLPLSMSFDCAKR